MPDEYILRVARVMRDADWHTFQVLTKRADRLRRMLGGVLAPFAKLPNIWWGVSVETRKHAVPRIALLQDAPAAARFLSIEPLLEDLGRIDLRGIDWVIVGGESGPGARPMERDWVVSLRDQCRVAGSVLLEAMGRGPEEEARASVGWAGLQRLSGPKDPGWRGRLDSTGRRG